MQLCICVKLVEDIHPASEPSHHSESDHDQSPVATTHDNRKRQAHRTASSPAVAKTRKSDSAVLLKQKHVSSKASVGDASVARRYKASSKGSVPRKSTGSSKVTSGRKEDSIKFLSAERKRLEKENEEKKRRLEELKKQDMMIEVAAKKGGGRSCSLLLSSLIVLVGF